MAYIDPSLVVSPKSRWGKGHTVLCNTGDGGWSLSQGTWDGGEVLALRWNGSADEPGMGNPSSHSNPTWFILPSDLGDELRKVAAHIAAVQSLIGIKIWRPEGYDWGVFEVEVTLSEAALKALGAYSLNFKVPTLKDRFFRIHEGYRVAPHPDSKIWRGSFIDGTWRTIVQTNGVPEDQNDTTMGVVRDAIIANVVAALVPHISSN